jgi:hypothetical protein
MMQALLRAGWYSSLLLAAVICGAGQGLSQDIPVITGVERQPLMASIRRLTEALAFAGAPLQPDAVAALDAAMAMPDDRSAVTAVQKVHDQYQPGKPSESLGGTGPQGAHAAGVAILSGEGAQ